VCPQETAPSPGQPLDLNHASEAELQRLPGIGPARARAIVAFREEHGGFRSVAQLLRVKGFGRATLRRLRPMLVVQGADASGTIAK
jgi:competence protein ComEA